MTLDPKKITELAAAYTAAWNSGSAGAVAEFFTKDGTIVINRGEPWVGYTGVTQMAAGFFADIPDLKLMCDEVRTAGDHVAYLWTFTGTHAVTKKLLASKGGRNGSSMHTTRSAHRRAGTTSTTMHARAEAREVRADGGISRKICAALRIHGAARIVVGSIEHL
jgi:uncharacterized protein (TIGR02246 family)